MFFSILRQIVSSKEISLMTCNVTLPRLHCILTFFGTK